MAGTLWVLSMIPYLITRGVKANKRGKYFSCLSVTSAMAHGFDVIILKEGSMEGNYDEIEFVMVKTKED